MRTAAAAPCTRLLARHVVAASGSPWKLTLRDGLVFHDGSKVLARNEEEYIRKPYGVFTIGAPMASDAGIEALTGPRDLSKVRAKIKVAGYAGEQAVLIVPIDYVNLKATADVWADLLKQVGLNVDYVATDWGQMLTRRNNRGPVDQGGWPCFSTGWSGSSVDTPAGHPPLRGTGDQKAAWPDWYRQARDGTAARRLVRGAGFRGAAEDR